MLMNVVVSKSISAPSSPTGDQELTSSDLEATLSERGSDQTLRKEQFPEPPWPLLTFAELELFTFLQILA